MKVKFLLLLAVLAVFASLALIPRPNIAASVSSEPREYAKCYGRNPCNACSNCSACKYCSGGGTCGVCESRASSGKGSSSGKAGGQTYGSSARKPAASSGQCSATTRKGTRCSRNARSGGYCWQHGG